MKEMKKSTPPPDIIKEIICIVRKIFEKIRGIKPYNHTMDLSMARQQIDV